MYEEEGVTEIMCDELIATPLPHPPAPLRGEGGKTGSKVKPRKKGVGGEDVLRFGFVSCDSILIFTGNKLN